MHYNNRDSLEYTGIDLCMSRNKCVRNRNRKHLYIQSYNSCHKYKNNLLRIHLNNLNRKKNIRLFWKCLNRKSYSYYNYLRKRNQNNCSRNCLGILLHK
ncbi:MAG: hypothetical protein IJQ83_07020 [Bacteroidales bacterium]|nr:hypothetical protein [Bacteroidales bacterium]